MKNVILMHIGQPTDDFLNDEGALLKREYTLFLLSLNRGKTSNITIFHEHKNPAIIYMINCLP